MHLKTEKIKKEWTDYNGHMNVAYYIHIFDIASDIMLDKFKMGGKAAKKNKKSNLVEEKHTNNNQEVRSDEDLEVHLTEYHYAKKRIHYRVSMFHKEKKYLAATNEVLSLYIDLNKRKVTEFDEEKKKIMDDLINDNSSKFNSDKLVFTSKLKK
jgi:acyl-CoA thioester hydrolase